MIVVFGLIIVGVGSAGLFLHRSLLRVGMSIFFIFLGLTALLLADTQMTPSLSSSIGLGKSGVVLAWITFFFGTLVAGTFVGLSIKLFSLSGKEDANQLESLRH